MGSLISSSSARAAVVGALAVGVAHYLTHVVFGEEESFDRAGVMEAGVMVALSGGLTAFAHESGLV